MSRFTDRRLKVSPMDFEYTSEERRKPPAWVQSQDPNQPEQKRQSMDVNNAPTATAFTNNIRSVSPGFAQNSSNAAFTLYGAGTSRATPPLESSWTRHSANAFASPSKPSGFTIASPIQEVSDVSMDDINASPLGAKSKRAIRPIGGQTKESEHTEENLSLVPARRDGSSLTELVPNVKGQGGSGVIQRRSTKVEEEEGDTEGAESDDGFRNVSGTGRRTGSSITANHHYTFNLPNTPVSRSEVPYMLLGYVQFLFNLSLVLVFLYIIIHCIITIQRDVEHSMASYRTELAEQIATCAQLYEINKCFPISQRVPALAKQCGDWESCMQKDPSGVGRARVVAETIGEVINSFVEPISWKTLIFGLISLGFVITFINTLFSFYRARVAPEHALHPSNPSHHPSAPLFVPTTPVHPRIAQAYPPAGYMASPIIGQQQPLGWSRTWSGTEMPLPIPGTPVRRKGKSRATSLAPGEGQ
ncbi:hypothetical protein FRB91_002681 [Serendipita sp. 411]|nr:hypothetical protein FRB91_002681 [Serendipita sp. 411]